MKALVAAALLLAGCRDCASGTPSARTSRPAHDAGARRPFQKVVRAVLPEATIGEAEGDVVVDRSRRLRRAGVDAVPDAGPVPATRGTDLEIGDEIVVGATGGVELRLPEQGRIDLGPQSRAIVSPWGMNELSLVRGRMHVSLESPGIGRRVLKVTMPGAYVLVQGTDLVVGAADDGGARILAMEGPASVRTAAGKVELAESGAMEIDAEGRAGRPAPAPAKADSVSSMDGWIQGRRELAARALGATLAKLAGRIGAEIDDAPAVFAKVSTRRDANRELLTKLREKGAAKAGPGFEGTAAQRTLAEASEALIDDTDQARAIFGRVTGRFELARALQASGPPEIDALAERVDALRAEASRLFRRSPRRPRPDAKGMPRPRLPGGAMPGQPTSGAPASASENH